MVYLISDETREKWVAALRSGEFEQAVGVLRTRDDKYCCLGVLCKIDPEVIFTPTGSQFCYSILTPESDLEIESELEDADLDYFGLDSDAQRYLVSANDEEGWDFKQIAAVIEKGEFVYSDGEDNHRLVRI